MAFDVLNQPPQPLELDPVHAPIQLDFSSPSAKTNFLHLQVHLSVHEFSLIISFFDRFSVLTNFLFRFFCSLEW